MPAIHIMPAFPTYKYVVKYKQYTMLAQAENKTRKIVNKS